MPWIDLQPAPPGGGPKSDPVTLSVSKKGRRRACAYVTVRPDLVPHLTWWRNGGAVSVQIGQGDLDGRIRIFAGGPFSISMPNGRAIKGRSNAPSLQIAVLPDLPEAGLKRTAVPWVLAKDALVITLPWAAATKAARIYAAGVLPPAPLRSPTPLRRPEPALATEVQMFNVMGKLQASGGKIRNFRGLTHADQKALRQCEEKWWTEWRHGDNAWLLTSKGEAALRDEWGDDALEGNAAAPIGRRPATAMEEAST